MLVIAHQQKEDIHVSMTVKTKDPNTGDLVDAHVVKVENADEPFSYITLEDGTELTMRTNVTQVLRLKDTWYKDGSPIYEIKANGNITITSPDKLKKKTSTDDN